MNTPSPQYIPRYSPPVVTFPTLLSICLNQVMAHWTVLRVNSGLSVLVKYGDGFWWRPHVTEIAQALGIRVEGRLDVCGVVYATDSSVETAKGVGLFGHGGCEVSVM